MSLLEAKKLDQDRLLFEEERFKLRSKSFSPLTDSTNIYNNNNNSTNTCVQTSSTQKKRTFGLPIPATPSTKRLLNGIIGEKSYDTTTGTPTLIIGTGTPFHNNNSKNKKNTRLESSSQSPSNVPTSPIIPASLDSLLAIVGE